MKFVDWFSSSKSQTADKLSVSSPFVVTQATMNSHGQRRIAIAVDLSDESAYAVKWAVNNYLRPGDNVILLHVQPSSVLYGVDWGSIRLQIKHNDHQKLEEDFDTFTTTKANTLAQPLLEAGVPFKIHIVKDHDLKERLCLEVDRLGLSAVIMGSRGFGAASRGNNKERLGSVSDYCVHHCICPVIVVRYDKEGESDGGAEKQEGKIDLHPVPEEEEEEYHDDSEEQKERKASSDQQL